MTTEPMDENREDSMSVRNDFLKAFEAFSVSDEPYGSQDIALWAAKWMANYYANILEKAGHDFLPEELRQLSASLDNGDKV